MVLLVIVSGMCSVTYKKQCRWSWAVLITPIGSFAGWQRFAARHLGQLTRCRGRHSSRPSHQHDDCRRLAHCHGEVGVVCKHTVKDVMMMMMTCTCVFWTRTKIEDFVMSHKCCFCFGRNAYFLSRF